MSGEDVSWQRLDKWLWCARFLRQRADCARWVSGGAVRINRQPTDKPHARVRVGDVLTLPWRGRIEVIKVQSLASRRGPASEATLLFRIVPSPDNGGCGGTEAAAYPADRAEPPLARAEPLARST